MVMVREYFHWYNDIVKENSSHGLHVYEIRVGYPLTCPTNVRKPVDGSNTQARKKNMFHPQ